MDYPVNELFFEFTWIIENFSMCRRKPDEPLSSPKFIVHFLLGTEWFLQIYPKGQKDVNTIMCFLHRTSNGPESIDVKYSISVEESGREVRQTFKKGSASEKMVKIDRARYFQKFKDSASEGDLKVVCRLKKGQTMVEDPGGIRPYPVCCSARSQVPVERRKVIWSIKKFASLPSQHEVSTSIVSASATTPKLLVTLSWSDETQKGGGKLKMEVREMPELVGKDFLLGCTVHLLDAKDQRRKLARGWYLFTTLQKRCYFFFVSNYSDSVWNFELDIDRGDLYQRRESLLKNGELVLECEFAISCDQLSCLVEETGFVHPLPKLPPQNIGVQATPTEIGWKEYILRELNNQTNIAKFFALLFIFLAVISQFTKIISPVI